MFARARSPFGARSSVVLAVVAVLGVVAGVAVASQFTSQMRTEAEVRLDAHTQAIADEVEATMTSASSDIRLARQNVVFGQALMDSPDQLLPADRSAVESAITY